MSSGNITSDQNVEGQFSMRQWGLALILLCSLPVLLMALGLDFSTAGPRLVAEDLVGLDPFALGEVAHHSLRGSFTHTLLEWTALCVAFFVGLMALVQYRLKDDSSLPVIGVALMCAGAIDGFHTLAADRLITAVAHNRELIPFTWAVSRLFKGAILFVGVGIFVLGFKPKTKCSGVRLVVVTCLVFLLAAYLIVEACATSTHLPKTMFEDAWIKRPYDLVPMIPLLLCWVWVYPRYMASQRTVFSSSLVLALIPSMSVQLYMAFGSNELHDSSFNIAHGLKVLEYSVPLLGILADYVQTYRNQRRLSVELEASQGRTRAVLDSAADGIVSLDSDLMILTSNQAANRILGVEDGRLIGSNLIDYISEAELSDPRSPLKWFGADFSHFPNSAMEVIGRQDDGTNFTMEMAFSQAKANADQITTVVFRDISKRKEHEQLIQKAHEAAQAATEAKSHFLANMSHEIRTPMTAILGFADNLLEGDSSEEDRLRDIQTIRRNSEYLLGILNDILDLSKIEAGKLTIERIQTPLLVLLREVCGLIRPRAEGKGLVLDICFETAMPESVEIDPTRLRQILINLLGNAVKFTEVGQVGLSLRWSEDEDGGQLSIVIHDSGIGMNEEETSKLFQAFSQADVSTTRKFGGTGLGLVISKRLASALGGGLELVESKKGVGSRFLLTIPADLSAGAKVIEDPASHMSDPDKDKPARKKRKKIDLGGCRILLAEDGPDNQRLISHILKKAGAEVRIAENGAIALDEVVKAIQRDEAFEVILMDMQMPVLDGYSATRELRAVGIEIPIIALTAHAMQGDKQKCLDAGCSDFASKPINRAKLLELIATSASIPI